MKPITGNPTAKFWACLAIAFIAFVSATPVTAQSYPARTIRMVIGFAPGGPNDVMARILSQQLTQSLGRTVVVDNRPGAGGIIGTDLVAKSPADGYTLLFASAPFTFVPSLYRTLPYDSEKDLVGITTVATSPMLLVVHPSVPFKSVRDLTAYAKAHPGKLNYGSGGVGSTPHLGTELLQSMAGIRLNHVPYKGGGLSLVGIEGGEIDILMDSITTTFTAADQGKVKALAVSTLKRSPKVPNIPTIAEAGVPGFEMTHWVGVIAPSKVPTDIIARLHREIEKALATSDAKSRLTEMGAEPSVMSPEAFQTYLRNEIRKWAKVVKDRGIQPQ